MHEPWNDPAPGLRPVARRLARGAKRLAGSGGAIAAGIVAGSVAIAALLWSTSSAPPAAGGVVPAPPVVPELSVSPLPRIDSHRSSRDARPEVEDLPAREPRRLPLVVESPPTGAPAAAAPAPVIARLPLPSDAAPAAPLRAPYTPELPPRLRALDWWTGFGTPSPAVRVAGVRSAAQAVEAPPEAIAPRAIAPRAIAPRAVVPQVGEPGAIPSGARKPAEIAPAPRVDAVPSVPKPIAKAPTTAPAQPVASPRPTPAAPPQPAHVPPPKSPITPPVSPRPVLAGPPVPVPDVERPLLDPIHGNGSPHSDPAGRIGKLLQALGPPVDVAPPGLLNHGPGLPSVPSVLALAVLDVPANAPVWASPPLANAKPHQPPALGWQDAWHRQGAVSPGRSARGVVPEPGTSSLMALGLLMLALRRR